jgi:hypothetical protein
MTRPVRPLLLLGALALAASGLTTLGGRPATADTTPQPLPFAQDWSDAGLIVADDDWSGVPGIVGHRGNGLASTGADPQTILADDPAPVVDVNANEIDPSTLTVGGIAQFHLDDNVVALQGSDTADAPYLLVTLDTTGYEHVTVGYTVRDLDAGADDATQRVALHYRVGTSGPFTNVPAAYVADATTPNEATQVTPVAVELPPAVSNQPAVQLRIMTADAPGADEWVGIDDLAVTGTPVGSGPAGPVATCPETVLAVAGDGASAVVSATDADSEIVDIALASPPVDGITLVPGEAGTATLVVAAGTAAGDHDVVVRFTTDDGRTASCEIAVSVLAISAISSVQGRDASSPRLGERVLVEAVVTSPFTSADALSGFFVQEEADDVDDDPATSEGLFVFCGAACPPAVAAGDVVRAVGVVQERFGTTQVSATAPGAVTVVGTAALPDPVVLDAPEEAAVETTYESIEGMVATFSETLTVTEHFNLARFGEIELVGGDRPFTFTHVAEPDPAGFAQYTAELANRTIVLDDDNDDENDAITGPHSNEPYPYPTAAWAEPATDGLSATHRFRTGDTIDGLTGVLQWSFGHWRLRPVPGVAYELTPANPATDAPDDVGGRLRVASFNVLNYFHTIDTTASDSTGTCGVTGTEDCRGADSEAERLLQLAKITSALSALNADVVGLIEIENDAGQATRDIVDALDARLGAGTYAPIETGFIGTDVIKVALIYRPDAVQPVGPHRVLTSADDPRFDDRRNRPTLVQTFEEIGTGERFTVAVNHLKSKGSSCAGDTPADPDLGDGAGNCNLSRTNAARALVDYLAGDPTGSGDPDVIILGDLNAYRNEDPVDVLREAGYTDLLRRFVGDGAYSYVFDGTIGYLDHALASSSLTPQVTGTTVWHVNANEPPLLDYNDDVRDVGEADFFERTSSALPLHDDDARRASDHDPVLVGLDLASLRIDAGVIVTPPQAGGTLVATGTTARALGECPSVSLRVDATTVDVGQLPRLGRSSTCAAIGAHGVFTLDLRTGAFTAVLNLPRTHQVSGDTVRFVLTLDDDSFAVDRAGRRVGVVWTAA